MRRIERGGPLLPRGSANEAFLTPSRIQGGLSQGLSELTLQLEKGGRGGLSRRYSCGHYQYPVHRYIVLKSHVLLRVQFLLQLFRDVPVEDPSADEHKIRRVWQRRTRLRISSPVDTMVTAQDLARTVRAPRRNAQHEPVRGPTRLSTAETAGASCWAREPDFAILILQQRLRSHQVSAQAVYSASM
jgi:hypothetical protein